jgi:hypothetical protein
MRSMSAVAHQQRTSSGRTPLAAKCRLRTQAPQQNTEDMQAYSIRIAA